MLEYLLNLLTAFSIGSSKYSVFSRKSWLVFIPKIGPIVTRRLLKICAIPLSLHIILNFFSRVMYSVDCILLKKRCYRNPKFLIISSMFQVWIFMITSVRFSTYTHKYIYLFVIFYSFSWILLFMNWFLNFVLNVIVFLATFFSYKFWVVCSKMFPLIGASFSNISINILLAADKLWYNSLKFGFFVSPCIV